jgi:hypothetical protein
LLHDALPPTAFFLPNHVASSPFNKPGVKQIGAQIVRQESYLPAFAALLILTQVLFRCATAAKISGSLRAARMATVLMVIIGRDAA